jgi:ferrochelatase
MIRDYHQDPGYIRALAASVRAHWATQGRAELLLLSFHGIPQEYCDQGDPYRSQCETTARLLVETLGLTDKEWRLCFQSRLGPRQWLQPYTDATLRALPGQGVRRVEILCPGFSADCLETLEEIVVEGRNTFLDAGGERFDYIPCLNDSAEHLRMLAKLVRTHCQGW